MSGVSNIGNPTGKGGGRRGKITGWSTASRRRMRSFLLTHRCVYERVLGVTLTIPGPPMPYGEAQRIFSVWAVAAYRAFLAAVWRVELQRRGALHWHLLCGLPPGVSDQVVGDLWRRAIATAGPATAWAPDWGSSSWRSLQRQLRSRAADEGAIVVEERWRDKGEDFPGVVRDQLELDDYADERWPGPCEAVTYATRNLWPGADRHAVKWEGRGGEGAWLRYLQDHATKAKQEQIPESIGRHWGVIGRERFEVAVPDEVCRLEPHEYARVVRWMQRLSTPRIRARCVFGRRLGYRTRRGSWGRSVWFTRAETVRRMVSAAMSDRVRQGGPE